MRGLLQCINTTYRDKKIYKHLQKLEFGYEQIMITNVDDLKLSLLKLIDRLSGEDMIC